jgi:hypothetical protein
VNIRRVMAVVLASFLSVVAIYLATRTLAFAAFPNETGIRIGTAFEELVGASTVLTWLSRAMLVGGCMLAGYLASRMDPARTAWVGALATMPYVWVGFRYLLRPPMPYYEWYWFLALSLIPVVGILGGILGGGRGADGRYAAWRGLARPMR